MRRLFRVWCWWTGRCYPACRNLQLLYGDIRMCYSHYCKDCGRYIK